jgi:2-desacetyl-2-hydroxyethyl bacteriochlorophyllide A dehydrogenase
MKKLVCVQPGLLAYDNASYPTRGQGEVILQVKRIGICGTDLHAYEGTQPYFTYPRVLGHELGCVVAEADPEAGYQVGESVTFMPYFGCGTCIACRNGLSNCCTSMKVFGVHIDGGMMEYIVVPTASLISGENMSVDELALVEPLAIGAHSIRRAAVQEHEFVLVVGAGPIGLGIAEFARIAGAEVIIADVNNSRLQFCVNTLHIQHTINPLEDDMMSSLQKITNGDMPTVVFDATGNLKAMENAFQYLAHGGRYVLVGLQKEAIHFSHPEFHKREATLSKKKGQFSIPIIFYGSSEDSISCLD